MNKIKVISLLLAFCFFVVAGLASAATTDGVKSSKTSEPFIVDDGMITDPSPSEDDNDKKGKDDKKKEDKKLKKEETPDIPKSSKDEPTKSEDKTDKIDGDNPTPTKNVGDSGGGTNGGKDNPGGDDTNKEDVNITVMAGIGALIIVIVGGFTFFWNKYNSLERKYSKLKAAYNSLNKEMNNTNNGGKSENQSMAINYEGNKNEQISDNYAGTFRYNKGAQEKPMKSRKDSGGNFGGKYVKTKGEEVDEKTTQALLPQEPPPQSRKKGIAEIFNEMMAEAAVAPGLMGKDIREKFAIKYKVTPYRCVNYEERLNNPEIPPKFEVCALGDSTVWAIPISGDKMAILPSLPSYEETAHKRGGMKELFESNYQTGSFRKIEVRQAAVVSKDFSNIRKGLLNLS